MGRWQIVHAYDGGEVLESYLAEGYEPFAVTETEQTKATIWLRRQTLFGDVPAKTLNGTAELDNWLDKKWICKSVPVMAGVNV